MFLVSRRERGKARGLWPSRGWRQSAAGQQAERDPGPAGDVETAFAMLAKLGNGGVGPGALLLALSAPPGPSRLRIRVPLPQAPSAGSTQLVLRVPIGEISEPPWPLGRHCPQMETGAYSDTTELRCIS